MISIQLYPGIGKALLELLVLDCESKERDHRMKNGPDFERNWQAV